MGHGDELALRAAANFDAVAKRHEPRHPFQSLNEEYFSNPREVKFLIVAKSEELRGAATGRPEPV
jgi:hypothetical protein